MPRLVVAVVLVVAALAGCGDDDEPRATPAPTPTATSPEDQPGGAGDEEAARVPVELTVGAEGIDPPEVSVPAFLALELIVRNETSESVTVRLEGAEPLSVGAGETARRRFEGRRPGRYSIDAGAAGSAELVTGVEAGP